MPARMHWQIIRGKGTVTMEKGYGFNGHMIAFKYEGKGFTHGVPE
jgi:hypothetical protein